MRDSMGERPLELGEIEAIVAGRHGDPFAVLGVHKVKDRWLARTFQPGADTIEALDLDGRPIGRLTKLHPGGLFEGELAVDNALIPIYRCTGPAGTWDMVDAYAFHPVLGPLDDYLSAEGSHLNLADRLGAHPMVLGGVSGVHFAVWAPNAGRVSVVGDFNGWDGRRHIMRKRLGSGLFEIFVPDIGPGALYKYELLDANGRLLPPKADPYAFSAELRPGTASRVADLSTLVWSDDDWLAARSKQDPRREPMTIYEVHLGSWRRRDDGGFLSYDDFADQLVGYVRDMGYTHIELMPVTEHPLDASWGYQPVGLFAPTSRFGDPAGFARFIDKAHKAGLGIILDWVPAHFPTDAHGLARFDGTALYEHADPRQGYHPDWNTAIYNFGRAEVANVLVNNALFWTGRYHIDGLRVDAVASMLYLDYSRKDGEWIPNAYGGRENLDAVAFLKRMNATVYGQEPGVVTIAEESTAWPGVSAPTDAGGLGFGFKWNMGFMHDTLQNQSRDAIHRRHHHDEITFGLLYAFTENFVLPLSHDEVVHGKGSLLAKMAGDDWQKFAGLRAYYAFMWGYPGKKLLFMGQEFAQREEWNADRGLDWYLLDSPAHAGVRALVRDLNRIYRDVPALHARDCEPEGFSWLIGDDRDNSVFAFARYDGTGGPPAVVVTNFTPVPREGYRVPFPMPGRWREAINTDSTVYWGSGLGNMGAVEAEPQPSHGHAASALVWIPPLATLIFVAEG
jgi:1,4-alpha-glucan branching enzyme